MIEFRGKPNNSVVQSYSDEKYDQTQRRDGLPASSRVYSSIDKITFDVIDISRRTRTSSPALGSGRSCTLYLRIHCAIFCYSAHHNKQVPYHFSIHTWLETRLNTWMMSLSNRRTATQRFISQSARQLSRKSVAYLFIRRYCEGPRSSLTTSHYILRSSFWRVYIITCNVILSYAL